MADHDTALGAITPPITFGKYALLERLALGPFIEAYRANALGIEGFETPVSIRMLRQGVESEDVVRTFVDAAKRAAALKHANIAAIVDLGKIDGRYYAAAEFVDGPTLGQLTALEELRVDVGVACHVAIRILEALEYAHNRTDEAGHALDMLHKGLAPDDVALSADGEVKLLNFGAASFHHSPQSQHGVSPERIGYMSPEQVRGLPLDRRSDTFALGIILHELLCGKRLFTGESEFEILEKIRKVEVTPPSLLNAAVPAALEDIVLRALAKNPAARFESAREMALDLQKFVFASETYVTDAEVAALVARAFPNGVWTAPSEAAPAAAPASTPAAAPSTPPSLPPMPELDWDDGEEATSVFARNDTTKIGRSSIDEELGEWSRDLATGVHRPRPSSSMERALPATLPTADTEGTAEPTADDILGAEDPGEATNVRRPTPPKASASDSPAAPRGKKSKKGKRRAAGSDKPAPATPPAAASAPAKSAGPPPTPKPASARPAGLHGSNAPAPSPTATPAARERSNGIWFVAAAALLGVLAIFFFLNRSAPTQAVHLAATPADETFSVLIDNTLVYEGPLPYVVQGVTTGPHTLTLRAPGHTERSDSVLVEAGADLRIDWQLQRAAHTTLALNSTPSGAAITLNGVPRGVTPSSVELPVGERARLQLTLDGYAPHHASFIVTESAAPVTITLSPDAPTDDAEAQNLAAAAPTAEDADSDDAADGTAENAAASADTAQDPEQAPAANTAQEEERVAAAAQQESARAAEQNTLAATAQSERPAAAERSDSPRQAEPSNRPPAADNATNRQAEAARQAAEAAAAAEREREAARAAREAEREAARAEREARRAREAQPAAAAAPPSSAQPAVAGPPGFLNVQSQPPATVIVDGETVGQTPLNGVPVSPGRHRVQLLNEAAGVDRTYRISIDSGTSRTIVNRTE